MRLGPDDDATAVTADQLRTVVGRLIAAGHWRDGDPNILIVLDAGTNGRPFRRGFEFALDLACTAAHHAHRHHPLWHRRRDHPGDLPMIEGILIRLQGDHLPGDSDSTPVWLWSSAIASTATHTQLRFARPLARDLRHLWENPPHRDGSPPPAYDPGSGTSARSCLYPSAPRDPPNPVPVALPAQRSSQI